jgi:hypothetical protein
LAAGNAVSGIAGGIAEVVVLAFVDDKSGTVVVEQRCGTSAESDVPYEILDGQLSTPRHFDIRQVAGVRTVGLQKPMSVADRREVLASGLEGRRITASRAM